MTSSPCRKNTFAGLGIGQHLVRFVERKTRNPYVRAAARGRAKPSRSLAKLFEWPMAVGPTSRSARRRDPGTDRPAIRFGNMSASSGWRRSSSLPVYELTASQRDLQGRRSRVQDSPRVATRFECQRLQHNRAREESLQRLSHIYGRPTRDTARVRALAATWIQIAQQGCPKTVARPTGIAKATAKKLCTDALPRTIIRSTS
jgi:hypothetical protein